MRVRPADQRAAELARVVGLTDAQRDAVTLAIETAMQDARLWSEARADQPVFVVAPATPWVAGWEADAFPRVLPADWVPWDAVPAGDAPRECWRAYQTGHGLRVLLSASYELDARRWLHVSVSRRSRLPSWEDVRLVKDVCCGADREALQKFPRAAEYVNTHPFTLHLWSCLDGGVTPDFTKGGGSL